jgi:hypothetical protein
VPDGGPVAAEGGDLDQAANGFLRDGVHAEADGLRRGRGVQAERDLPLPVNGALTTPDVPDRRWYPILQYVRYVVDLLPPYDALAMEEGQTR